MKNIPRLKFFEFLFSDTRMAWLWLVIRLYVGYEWLTAGWEKLHDAAWVGASAGSSLNGFLLGALQKTSGAHPSVSSWYGWFIEHIALPHSVTFSYLVTGGEILVGAALILGFLTGKAAFWGGFMSLNFLLAGTGSINPQMLILEVLLVAAWRTAGWYGIDRYILPRAVKKFGGFFVA
jgi:thiosulfate dehydrogenase (quinone) large subunit